MQQATPKEQKKASNHYYDPEGGDLDTVLTAKMPDFQQPIVLYHGTSIFAAMASGLLGQGAYFGGLKLSSAIDCDFSRGADTAFYWTPSRELAEAYAWQSAYNTNTEKVLFTATFNPAAARVKLKVFEDLEEWREALTWGWTGKGYQPASLEDHNVIAGWTQTRVKGVFWPAKFNFPEGSKHHAVYWQVAITSRAVLDGLTDVQVTHLREAKLEYRFV